MRLSMLRGHNSTQTSSLSPLEVAMSSPVRTTPWISGGLIILTIIGALTISACRMPSQLAGGIPITPPGAFDRASATFNSTAPPPPGVIPEPPSTEEYAKIEENEFLEAGKHPLSTLSTDVDTAAYSNVRRFLHKGELPPADAVKLEEMINYFSYDYPQSANRPLSITTDLTICPWNETHLLARVAIRGRSISKTQMPPRNFVFLVDTSGSMEKELPLLKSSLRLLVKQLRPRDQVALVTYADGASVALKSTSGRDKEKILQAINFMSASGGTNGGEGIQTAYRIAQENFIQGGLNRVILGTDGDFNVGVSSEAELIKLIEKKRKSKVYLSVLGMGQGNLKAAQMEALAEHGNGQYAYLDSQAEAHKIFVEQGGALMTVAKDVKLQVEFNPARIRKHRLLGYENRVVEHQMFNNDEKDAADVGAGQTVTALYELVPETRGGRGPGVDPLRYEAYHQDQPHPSEVGREWLTVKLRYKDPESEQSNLIKQSIANEPTTFKSAPGDFQFASSVAAFGMLLRDSAHKGKASFDMVSEIARRSKGRDENGHRGEFLKLIETARGLRSNTN